MAVDFVPIPGPKPENDACISQERYGAVSGLIAGALQNAENYRFDGCGRNCRLRGGLRAVGLEGPRQEKEVISSHLAGSGPAHDGMRRPNRTSMVVSEVRRDV